MSEAVHKSLEELQAEVSGRGMRVDLPGPNELFIDIDAHRDLMAHRTSMRILTDAGLTRHWEITFTPSPSGEENHYHVRIRTPMPLTELERVGLQAILGSDRKREALGLRRVLKGEKPVTVFFEKEES